MKKQNIFYSTSLALVLMAAGSVFAVETAVAEITQAKVQEQHTEQQQKMNQQRKEMTKQDGQGEQHKQREMNGQAGTEASAGQPGEQGATSVNKHLESNPDNKGLQTASGKLEKNQYKHAEQSEKRSAKKEQHMTGKPERQDKVSRPAKAERPGL